MKQQNVKTFLKNKKNIFVSFVSKLTQVSDAKIETKGSLQKEREYLLSWKIQPNPKEREELVSIKKIENKNKKKWII